MVNHLDSIKLMKLLNTDKIYYFVLPFYLTQNVHARNETSVSMEISYGKKGLFQWILH
jgi:hypothetical protein